MNNPHHIGTTIRLFASHSWTHSRRRVGLHSILQPWVRGLDFEDYSISRAHPLNTDTDPELARELRNIIVSMDALLIMAGMYSNNSPWMQFEIDMAFAFDVPIIPILAYGQERVPRLPTRLATCSPVRWRGDSIREAVLRCISYERRQALDGQVAYRVAIAEEVERQKRSVEIVRRAQTAAWPILPNTARPQSKLPPPPNAFSDYLKSQPELPATFLTELLRRR